MKRFKSCLLASAGLVILAVTLSFTTPGRAFAQRVEEGCIRICDTASNPIHVIVQGITRVTGEVTINNQNAIATTVTGPVTVRSSSREPLHVFQPLDLENIFQEEVTLKLGPNQSVVTKQFTVPANKYLEIKSSSGTLVHKGPYNVIAGIGGFAALVRIRVTRINNNIFNYGVAMNFQGLSNAPGQGAQSLYLVGGNQLAIFADTVDQVEVVLFRPLSVPIESTLELAITGVYHPA